MLTVNSALPYNDCTSFCEPCGLASLEASISRRQYRYQARFENFLINSRFQPIMDPLTRGVHGYEGLSRVRQLNGNIVNTKEVFSQFDQPLDIVRLDRLSRTLHLRNSLCRRQEGMLFLNLDPRLSQFNKTCSPFFASLLEKYEVDPSGLVIEIIESHIEDTQSLKDIVDFFKDLGCKVAIDDFGAGNSNFDRLYDLDPDYIKLDRLFINRVSQRGNAVSFLKRLVALFKELGAKVVVEGVENEREHLLAIESEADYVQGYFYGVPV